MILEVIGIHDHALRVIAIETINSAGLHNLRSSFFSHGEHTTPTIAVFLHLIDRDTVIGHPVNGHDLLPEQINGMLVKPVIDIRQRELAVIIDDNASSLIAVGIMLHEPEDLTVNLHVVNRVPCADMTSNRQT